MVTLYFGCLGDKGHYLWDKRGHTLSMNSTPWGNGIDGRLCPDLEYEGWAKIHHKEGWTAVAFWDRGVDTRPGSNSVFVVHGNVNFDEAVRLAKGAFPSIWARFKFEVKLDGVAVENTAPALSA